MCPQATLHPRFLASELPDTLPQEAYFHILSAPLEASVSYGKGTALGPEAIIEASDQLELWDGHCVPADRGIYTWPPISMQGTVEEALERIDEAVSASLAYDALPILLGGEHTVSYGALKALQRKHGTFGIIQIDAHADLRDTYEESPWSHACVMRRAAEDLGLPLMQLGVRALCLEEVAVRERLGVHYVDAETLAKNGIAHVKAPASFPDKLYISFDVDGLDPSIMPATGTPVPGGLLWYDALQLVEQCVQGRSVIGMDIVEFAPMASYPAADFTAARLVYALISIAIR